MIAIANSLNMKQSGTAQEPNGWTDGQGGVELAQWAGHVG